MHPDESSTQEVSGSKRIIDLLQSQRERLISVVHLLPLIEFDSKILILSPSKSE
nr:hypothetical protein [Sicyoidochytrium minutum DNA virus]